MAEINLNPEQEQAANHTAGPCLVTAAPGSGKTRVIVERTARLMTSGVPPTQILSITFTNKAADEMKRRLLVRLGEPAKLLTMCTIHAWCAKCLRRYGHMLGYGKNMVILDEDEQVDMLAQVARQLMPQSEDSDEESDKGWSKKVLKKLAGKMDNCREKLMDEDRMQRELDKDDVAWFPIAREYLRQLQPKNRIDFSGLLCEVVRLLEEHPEALKAIHDRFKYFQIDEAQDTNLAQFRIVDLIGSASKNVFIVGDFDQCQPGNSLAFTSDKIFKPLSELDPTTDRLVSFDRHSGYAVGRIDRFNSTNRGYRFEIASRDYTGSMYEIKISDTTSVCTGSHKWPIKILKKSNLWAVYLMQKGNRFRIGQCGFYGSEQSGFGFAVRCRLEAADRGWVLSTHKTRQDALIEESSVATNFGLSEVCFQGHSPGYGQKTIDAIYSKFNPDEHFERAKKCLESFGRNIDYPFFDRDPAKKYQHQYLEFSAFNLIPQVMAIPISTFARNGSGESKRCQWAPIESITVSHVENVKVFSLNVEKHHKYITNGGFVTCNSIYGFRGARPENLTDFINEYNPRIIRLGQNYRSTPQIVATANALIRHNPNRPADDFRTENPCGAAVSCRRMTNSDEEAKWISDQVRQAITRGIPPAKIAVLYRLNRMSRSIEMAMMAQRIPYMIVGGFSFFDRAEIKDHLSMLRLMLNPSDGLAFGRVANKPKRAMGDSTVAKLERFAAEQGISILDACARAKECLRTSAAISGAEDFAKAYQFEWKGLPLAQALRTISERMRYVEFLRKDDKDTAQDRTENVEELITHATQYGIAEKSLTGFIDKIALMGAVDKAEKKKNAVVLQTLHSCKGLEYSVVFMPGVEHGLLPHSRSIEELPEGIEEERRICYVGMTRAEKELYVTYCAQRLNSYAAGRNSRPVWSMCTPSQFLYEAGLLKQPVTTGTIADMEQL